MKYNQLMESTHRSVRDLNLPPNFWKSQTVRLNNQQLDSLDGCPDEILGSFECCNNNLTSLKECPSIVGGSFYCGNNSLTSLADIHTHVQQMNGIMHIGRNLITSHILGILLIQGCDEVVFDYIVDKKSKLLLQAVEILNKYLPQGRAGIMECQAELIAADLGDFAQI